MLEHITLPEVLDDVGFAPERSDKLNARGAEERHQRAIEPDGHVQRRRVVRKHHRRSLHHRHQPGNACRAKQVHHTTVPRRQREKRAALLALAP